MSTYRSNQKRLRLRRNPNMVVGWRPELESEMATAEEMKNDSVPSLPMDLVGEIFCRLPVKLLGQLRCMCKSWNCLISERNFTRKHLRLSTSLRLHYAKYKSEPHELIHNSYPLHSVLTNIPTKFKERRFHFDSIVGSCDGILCVFEKSKGIVVLWNPCLKKFIESPPFENSEIVTKVFLAFGFGYDRLSDNYKVVVLYYSESYSKLFDRIKVKVHTLGTNCWRTIETFPFGDVFDEQYGTYVRGTIHWIAYTEWCRKGPLFILCFDLGNDSCQKLLPPHHADISPDYLTLSVLRDSLCLISDHHIWVMKEYGIHDSWTKLCSVTYIQDPSMRLSKALYVFDDDRLLLETHEETSPDEEWKRNLVVYDPKNDTFKVTMFKNFLYVSLISCS